MIRIHERRDSKQTTLEGVFWKLLNFPSFSPQKSATMDDDNQQEEYYDDDGGFEGYVEDTVDPGPWLLIGTCVFCFGVMLVVVPLLVTCTLKQRKQQKQQKEVVEPLLLDAKTPVKANTWSVLSFD